MIAGEGRRVAFVQDFAAFEEDCRRAAVIVSRIQAPPNCSVSLLLDRDALKERGAATLRFGTQTVEILSVRKGREVLPWRRRALPPPNSPAQDRPRRARPVPEQDFPDEDVSTGEPD